MTQPLVHMNVRKKEKRKEMQKDKERERQKGRWIDTKIYRDSEKMGEAAEHLLLMFF